MDREKVIGHLNDCMEASRRDNTWVFVRKDIVEDALALLKEQQEQIDHLLEESASNAEMAEGLKELLKEDISKTETTTIVRCRECKHYHKGFNCDLLQKPIMKGDDWFCADGVKRDE